MRLLIVEDNHLIAELTARALGERGFASDCVTSLAEADEALDLAEYDALVLDLGMPDGDGREWLTRRRRGGNMTVPVIVLTAQSALGDRIAGLDAGADDYLVKPFAVEELAARLRAMMRRPGNRGPSVMAVGALRFDSASRTVTLDDRRIDLSRRECALLELMMQRAGTIISRRSIETALYGFDEAVTPNAIEVLLSRLRRKLAEAGGGDLFVTLRGVGYLMRDGR